MAKRIRVYELAKEIGVDSKEVLSVLSDMGITGKSHMTALDADLAQKVKSYLENGKTSKVESGKSHGDGVKSDTAAERTLESKDAVPKDSSDKRTSGQAAQTRTSQAASRKDKNEKEERVVKGNAEAAQRESQAQKEDLEGETHREPVTARNHQSSPRRDSHFAAGHGARKTPENKVIGARRVVIQGDVPLRELASLVGAPIPNVIRTLMSMGVLISINQNVPKDIAVKVAQKMGCVVTVKAPEKNPEELIAEELNRPDDPEKAVPRPPVVTVMGHVDHGKTSLLDAIRHTNVTSKEAGGITQHIGASVVEHEGNKIIFLDTPGHEAFTEMRARGAKVTDVAVLVVAADDGVMPQTIEAINHAKAAGVPIVVAINKIDKPGAKPERVKQQLAEVGLLPEEWGGDTVVTEVSAKTGQGIDDLLEMILLVAEMQELKADPTRKAKGYIIESQIDKGRGPVATALIRTGVLQVGDAIITDTTWGKVRAMFDGRGRQVKKAGPSTPVEIVGLEELPQAGDSFLALEDEKLAKEVSEQRKLQRRTQELEPTRVFTLEDLLKKDTEEQKKELKLVVKSDVQGSLEAILQALGKMHNPEVGLSVIHSGVGAIIESDVMLAKASSAIVLGFNVRPDVNARNLAESQKVEIRTYRIIYDLLDDVENMLKGMVKPKVEEVQIGQAEVRATFHVPNVGTVAGCRVASGKINRHAKVRLVRDGVVVFEGRISSLKRFKEDVTEVSQGYECGVGLEKYQDIKPGDIIEAFISKEVTPA